MTLILNPAQFYTLYSPSKCEKRLYLDAAGIEPSPPGAYVQILSRLGQRHEKAKINTYIERYGDRDGIAERVLANLSDLLPITRKAIILPEPSYSLKVVEKYTGFRRTQDKYGGDWSMAKYIEAVETDDETKRRELIDEIIKYNEEDLKATWKVLEWLKRFEG